MIQALTDLIRMSGLAHLTYKEIIMIIIACIFLYLAIKKGYEPYLLIPIAFGILLVNLPLAGLMTLPTESEPGGLIYYLYQGTNLGIYPPLIFLCLGAATDFGPLIANPKTLLLGGAAQFGIFAAFFGALALGMTPQEAASVGIIGGADGPTAIYLTTKLANHLLSVIALAAYSYMALVPLIQPPIMRLLTTEKERQTVMKQMRVVSKNERILFPIVTTIFVSLVVPSATALVGMLMLGNLIRESGQVPKLTETLQNAMMYTITVILGVTVGAKANGELFLSLTTIKIIVLGLFAFSIGTAAGVLMGKLMYKLTNGKVNPLIGAAGVSAVPMAARVVQKEGIKYNPSNYLLMHAMGPNVAGVIGSAVAAGVLLAFFG
ncbi:sodium ion-translocating decarboxylase subunit beta [Trichococcus shcherbakoviae]|uniref:Sodium ion-translocating decarboxylase subunit beta n=1 Tax=Trichococcus shcherbakoviae subsp. psychrophilus TaxID=2585775 RepID=A0A5C5E9C1_9LACT|nr:sodium ion-translocating decarboxylase subunit beta [Trichococcus shcherbakoviae]TNV67939.1 sodium ion-translocating decarboxylase subunit beta [Trichococcus shcherbakoviae subsp. psychrophilus]TNV69554.1 sodium ion-translocating decarboxylase subunit beta [Trichococcus shcherbakoviae subsp. psychrophilus]